MIANNQKGMIADFFSKPSLGVHTVHGFLFRLRTYSVSLGADSPKQIVNQHFLSHLKNEKALPRQTKRSDKSNLWLMFSNNVYTDFIAASKHILIPSYNIQQNQNVTKLNINCFFSAETGQDQNL